MRKGIWQEFDGYEKIIAEIEAGRKFGDGDFFDKIPVDYYINRLHPATMHLRIADIIDETPSTQTIRLVSENGYLPPFQAGQYISLCLEVDGILTSRPYSISSAPNQTGLYDITIRRVENGLVSNFMLDRAKKGAVFESSGPAGHFHFNPLVHDKTLVCIAGGSGITPFMSMIREIVECGLDRTIYLLYGNQTTDDIIFHQELSHISERFDNIHYHPVIEEPADNYEGLTGFINADLIRNILGDGLADKTFFLCGPQGMYDFCLPELEKLGIARRKIKKEVYGTPLNIREYPGWPQSIKADAVFKISVKNGKQFEVRAGEALLPSLEKNGILIPTVCRSGECSMCRIKVLSGKVFQPASTPVRKSDRKYGYIHACVSYPLENLEILL